MHKNKLSETDIRAKLVIPALTAAWSEEEQVYRDYTLRLGRVIVRGRAAARDSKSVGHSAPIPLPPLAEQHRIVACVEELRLASASLLEGLIAAQRTQRQLADAPVAEVG